ncbi:uncharacterized protein LOC135209851 [Macrobrachium nipponense]|uniref:uncharacterized protein LOC135209851 n=1 Tax=Macrobrachium nipponense TaxID=159736 RepID=UPI0030C8BBAF
MESCFLFAMDKKREWYEARSFCRDQSADLAFLDDGDLHFQIIDYIVSHRDWRDEGFHIGGNDADVEGQWNWVMPQQPMDMGHHWWPGQPDGGRKENFACLYTPDFFFNSCVNGQRLYTLCRV